MQKMPLLQSDTFYEDEKEVTLMSNYFESLQEQALNEQQESIAVKLIRLGQNTLEGIAECTGLTLGRVKTLAKTASA